MENWKEFHKTRNNSWQVSDHGRIKKVAITTNKYARNYGKEFIVTPSFTGGNERTGGYLAVASNWKNKYVHRIVAEAFIPNPKGKRCINHIDGNKSNNHVDNLEWATHSENIQHALKTGLFVRRGAHLTPEERDRRIKERKEKGRQKYLEKRREIMYARWSPYLLLDGLTDNEQRYIRLRMENCNIPTIADRIGMEMTEVYRLKHQIQKKKMKQTGNYNILKLY
ncbi:MAG: HNH endonuclease [Gammaproteobacteria bacterium]|nr:HNH endonuclease [Gammaproteobacteria bacterium]